MSDHSAYYLLSTGGLQQAVFVVEPVADEDVTFSKSAFLCLLAFRLRVIKKLPHELFKSIKELTLKQFVKICLEKGRASALVLEFRTEAGLKLELIQVNCSETEFEELGKKLESMEGVNKIFLADIPAIGSSDIPDEDRIVH